LTALIEVLPGVVFDAPIRIERPAGELYHRAPMLGVEPGWRGSPGRLPMLGTDGGEGGEPGLPMLGVIPG